MRITLLTSAAIAALCLGGCADDAAAPGDVTVPSTYTFASSVSDAPDGVSTSGQIARHVLIADLGARIGGLTGLVDGAAFPFTSADQVFAYLDYYLRFDSDVDGGDAIGMSTSPAVLADQQTYAGISAGKDLVGKLAGQDSATDHADWNAGGFKGWSDAQIAASGGDTDSPLALVEALLHTLSARAIDRANNGPDMAPTGQTLPVHVTPEGWDLQQLSQKFLLMAITYSQGTDDYLDDGTEGKGILTTNLAEDGARYTPLEHAWDEGFGYFGAARDLGDYADDEIAGKGGRDDWQGYHDSDGDGAIDVTSEVHFGAAVNAAKRDLGAAASSTPTDYTGQAFVAFRAGRAIISAAAGAELSADQLAALEAQRDLAVDAWERAIAATVVHYINEVLADLGAIGSDAFSFVDYAKHWSELKGFALGLQFNPRSQSAEHFHHVHGRIGSRPVDPTAAQVDRDAYGNSLIEARGMLMNAYGFPADMAGDASGAGGW